MVITMKQRIIFSSVISVMSSDKLLNYIVWTADDRELADVLHSVAREYRERSYSMVTLQEKFSSFTKPGMSQKDSIDALIKAAVELTTPEAPAWEMISARILSYRSEKKITVGGRVGTQDLLS